MDPLRQAAAVLTGCVEDIHARPQPTYADSTAMLLQFPN